MEWTAFSNTVIFARHPNQFKAGRGSPAKHEKGALGTGGGTEATGWVGESTYVQDVLWLTLLEESGHLPPPHHASHSSHSSVTHRMQRALTAGLYTGRHLWKSRAASNSGTHSQLSSVTSAAPTPEGLRAINAPTSCNSIIYIMYQIICNIITLPNYAAVFLIFAYLIIYAHLVYLYLHAYPIPVCLIWK